MSTIKYSDLLDDVLPSLAADPSDPVTEYAIKRTVIDFCAESWVWRHLPDALDVEAGESGVYLEAPLATEITTLIGVAYDGVPIDPKNTDWLDANIPAWRTNTGTPKYFTQVDTEQLILAPVPSETLAGGLSVTLALQPSHNSTGFPRWIANKYLYVLADGALARLMLMPNKPWTDVQMGAALRTKFEAGIANARASAVAALGRAPLRTASQH